MFNRHETEQQQPASSIPEYAPRDIEATLLMYLEKAKHQGQTKTATLILTYNDPDTDPAKELSVFMIPHPKAPNTGIVFPGGAIETRNGKPESSIHAALREIAEEIDEVKKRGFSEFACPYNALEQEILKAVSQSHPIDRHFALTGEETRRGDSGILDKIHVALLSKGHKNSMLASFLESFLEKFISIPQPPIPPIYPKKPYTEPNSGAHMVAWSLTQPNSSFLGRLKQIRAAINNLYLHEPEIEERNTQLIQLAEEVLASVYGIERQASDVYQLIQEYREKYGNDLSVPPCPTNQCTDHKILKRASHKILEQASYALLKQIKDLYNLVQFTNLLYLTNKILRTIQLRYPADAVSLALLSLNYSIGRYNPLPPQYIVYFPFGNPYVLVASTIPGTNEPILVTINKGTGSDSPSQRQRLSARIYLLRPATYFRLRWLFNNPH